MQPSPESVRFGPFRLDPHTLELWHHDRVQPLEPLNARILLRLASEPGTMVPRRELQELGWPNLPGAAEQSLNTAVHHIRRVLAKCDDGSAVELETLRGRGYRLSVTAPTVVSRSATPSRSRRVRVAALGTAVAVLLGLAYVRYADTIAVITRGDAGSLVPVEVNQALERALYLAEATGDLGAARDVLDSARVRFPQVATLQATWAELSFWLRDLESAERGTASALRLDSGLPAAHRTRGLLALLRGDWTAAESAFQRALALDPSDSRTLTNLAYWRIIEGRFTDADVFIRQALQHDPLSTILHRDAGHLYLLASRYEEAERYCREVLRFQSQSAWATNCMFDLMVLQARTGEAATWGRRLVEISGGPDVSEVDAHEVVTRVEAWRLEEWTRATRDGAYPYGLALALAANGRLVDALRTLQTAAATPTIGLLTFGVDPRLASLREQPDFRTLLERLLPV